MTVTATDSVLTIPRGRVEFHLHAGAHRWADVFGNEGIEWWFAEAWAEQWGASMPHVAVHVHPRSAAESVYVEHYRTDDGKTPDPLPPYSFRGWADYLYPTGPTVFLFVDETETGESILWLLLHELTHIALAYAPFLRYAFSFERDALGLPTEDAKGDEYITNDALHERFPEEVFCNRVATAFMGGESFDRLWWRERVRRMTAREAA